MNIATKSKPATRTRIRIILGDQVIDAETALVQPHAGEIIARVRIGDRHRRLRLTLPPEAMERLATLSETGADWRFGAGDMAGRLRLDVGKDGQIGGTVETDDGNSGTTQANTVALGIVVGGIVSIVGITTLGIVALKMVESEDKVGELKLKANGVEANIKVESSGSTPDDGGDVSNEDDGADDDMDSGDTGDTGDTGSGDGGTG